MILTVSGPRETFIIPLTIELIEQYFSPGNEVLNEWRTLDLPIMPPVPVSFHTFPHKPPGLHYPAKHVFVCDYRTPQLFDKIDFL